MFRDRKDAGRKLASALERYRGVENGIVLGVPRGGVVPAKIVADYLDLPLDVIMVKKIGHPQNPEYAIGAVSLKTRILDKREDIDPAYIERETERIRTLMKERYVMYFGDREPIDLKGKKVIVVDDGIATGHTLIAALDMIREEGPEELIVAVPVGPSDSVAHLKDHADKVLCLDTEDDFFAISQFYDLFDQVSDEEVVELLRYHSPHY